MTPIISALVAAAARIGTPHQALSIGTLRMPPPMPSEPETTPASADTTERDRQPLDPIDHLAAALLVVVAAAEPARIGRRVEHVPPIEPLSIRTAMSAVTIREARGRASLGRAWNVSPAATPPAADATSSSMPSRRLIRLRPTVLADTALDVAMTVIRLVATAILIGRPTRY